MADAFPDYGDHDALALADLVRRGDVSPGTLLDAAIARIEAGNPGLNAVVTPLYDHARAAIAAGLPDGPFRGVPFLLKDLGQLLAGARLTQGSRLFQDFIPDRDNTLVARYKAAGLVIAGKTNTPELGPSITTESFALGPARNPWDLARSPGGSSGGAAAAVAAGFLPMAHASDGGGSIRAPAAHCGLYGFKPSRARNPVGPDIGEALNGLSTAHCVSWTVRDSAALLDATHGPEPGDPYQVVPPVRPFLDDVARDPEPLRIALTTRSPLGGPVDPAAVAAAEAAARLLESLGHRVEEAAPDYDAAAMHQAWRVITGAIMAVQVESYAKARGIDAPLRRLEPQNAALIEAVSQLAPADYFRAQLVLQAAGRRVGAFFQRYDVLLSPAMAAPAPVIGELAGGDVDLDDFYGRMFGHTPFTAIFNTTGGPAAAVPFDVTTGGLPIGIQIGADLGRDGLIFALSGQLERARPWRHRRPPK